MGCVLCKRSSESNNGSSKKPNEVILVVEEEGRNTTASSDVVVNGGGNVIRVNKEHSNNSINRSERKKIGDNQTVVIDRLKQPKINSLKVQHGWPSWLSAVAGDAIQGWIPRRADTFEKLDKV